VTQLKRSTLWTTPTRGPNLTLHLYSFLHERGESRISIISHPPASVAAGLEIPKGKFVFAYVKLDWRPSYGRYRTMRQVRPLGSSERLKVRSKVNHMALRFLYKLTKFASWILRQVETGLDYQVYSRIALHVKVTFILAHANATRSRHAVPSDHPFPRHCTASFITDQKSCQWGKLRSLLWSIRLIGRRHSWPASSI
jgi:hypothetical protein